MLRTEWLGGLGFQISQAWRGQIGVASIGVAPKVAEGCKHTGITGTVRSRQGGRRGTGRPRGLDPIGQNWGQLPEALEPRMSCVTPAGTSSHQPDIFGEAMHRKIVLLLLGDWDTFARTSL